ncbi:glycoside hydrolase family 72 protein [Polychaeton citri CBS 116435]|uniref:1,3-beta-glucanosyltransferase n=1 Tax=Polychaeton citri CBS 116435 TaxID=1314669 RepID=A0A9P4QBL3_9PEZI|nr:glycoside hydrolase family 72 protein [Polychaeton citri CBS 116435]
MKGAFALAIASAALAYGSATPARVEARASGSSSGALPTVTVKGNAFFAGDERFYIRGIDYQPGGSSDAADPLSDPSTCKRDIEQFQKLGLNTIRVYTVDNSKNHDECMSALADAGIYLALDVNSPHYSLRRDKPGQSYNPTYLQSVFATIDAFAGYSNTLLFFSGNEVINDPTTVNCAPYVKAVNRDMKQYIGERGYRAIPVGYSAADVSENQYLMAQYMDCGSDNERADFYAINNYEWCDPSTFEGSGWSALVEQYKNYSKPLFMSEYGCITNKRAFQETGALYQSDMTSVFSGGLVYEYAEEGSGYGIVQINGDSVSPIDTQFDDLQNALKNNPAPSGDGGYQTNSQAQDCPAGSDNWDIKPFTDSAIPAMPSGAAQYMKNGAGKGPGLDGDGSQDASGGSSATADPNAGSVTATFGSGPTGTGSSSSSSSSSSGNSGSNSGADAASSGNAAPGMIIGDAGYAPFICSAVVFFSSLFGATLL